MFRHILRGALLFALAIALAPPARAGDVPPRMPVVKERVPVTPVPVTPAPPSMMSTPAPIGPGMGVHFIYLIRHGMYVADTVNTDERLFMPLTPLGHEQARLVGARLAALPIRFRLFVSSDFMRARETADEIGAILRMAPVQDSLIHECTPRADNPTWTKGHSADELAWCESNLAAAWAKYVTPTPDADTHDLLVCHGNVIRWMVAKALGGETSHCSHMDIGNCSLTVIAIRPDGMTRLVMFSDVGHLPLDKQTWTGRGAGWK